MNAALAADGPGEADGVLDLLVGSGYDGGSRRRAIRGAHGVSGATWPATAGDRENCAIVPLASSGLMEKAVDVVVAAASRPGV